MTTISYEIPGTDQRYWVYEVDAHGVEVPETSSGSTAFVTRTLVDLVTGPDAATDVVVAVHGWNTFQRGNEEIPWFQAFFENFMRDAAAFPPAAPQRLLLIGVHWPSAPGSGRANERFDGAATFEENAARMHRLVASLRKTDPPAGRRVARLLATLSDVAAAVAPPLPQRALDAHIARLEQTLDAPEAHTGDSDSDSEDPAADAAAAAPPQEEEMALEPPADAGGGILAFAKAVVVRVLRPLEDALFGKFVRRAHEVGGGVHRLLALLQEAAGAQTRFHLVAHSLGATALCRALAGPAGGGDGSDEDGGGDGGGGGGGGGGGFLLRKKVTSAVVLQGSMGSRAFARGGQFANIAQGLQPVAGPLVFTTSQSDTVLPAYGFFHDEPIGLTGARDCAPLPKEDAELGDVDTLYAFAPGRVYNVAADRYIDEGGIFAGGSHTDVHDQEVMRMIRQAMQTEVEVEKYALGTAISKEFFRERLKMSVDVPQRLVAEEKVERGNGRWWCSVM